MSYAEYFEDEHPDQAYIDYWTDKVQEEASEADFGADGPEDDFLEERYEDSVSWEDYE